MVDTRTAGHAMVADLSSQACIPAEYVKANEFLKRFANEAGPGLLKKLRQTGGTRAMQERGRTIGTPHAGHKKTQIEKELIISIAQARNVSVLIRNQDLAMPRPGLSAMKAGFDRQKDGPFRNIVKLIPQALVRMDTNDAAIRRLTPYSPA